MQKLLDLIYKHDLATWSESAAEAFKELLGGKIDEMVAQLGVALAT